VTKVARSTSSKTLPRQIKVQRMSRSAGVAATGVTASEFVARRNPRPGSSRASSVPWRSVAYAFASSPRDTLPRVFHAIKRAATANVFQRIAERLAGVRSTAPHTCGALESAAPNRLNSKSLTGGGVTQVAEVALPRSEWLSRLGKQLQ
jgi:hypothetical protein